MAEAQQNDDFDNDKDVIAWRRQREEFQKMINDSIKVITDRFNASKSGHKNLKHFMIHKSIEIPMIYESYLGSWKEREIYITIFDYESSVHAGRVRNSGSDYYFAGVIQLTKSYPHTIIQPETLALKVENLITKADIDINHSRKFSRKFHMITKDKQVLEFLLANKNLNSIAIHPGAEIEISGHQCYFRESRKPVSIKSAEQFVSLAKTLFEIF